MISLKPLNLRQGASYARCRVRSERPRASRQGIRFRRFRVHLAILLMCFFSMSRAHLSVQAALAVESGDFVTEVTRLKELIFDSGSGLYVPPTVQEQNDFKTMANALWLGDLAAAESLAATLGYEVVEFSETVSGSIYYGLREVLVGGAQVKGWGTYFVNLNFKADALVEVPHPLWDTHSWDIGAKSFRDGHARGFLLAGAHRNANGTNTADVAHIEESIFHRVHEAWVGAGGTTDTWQIHGFDLDKHGSFPADSDAVLSNGDGSISDEVFALDQHFEADGFQSYAYNTLDPNDPLNLLVNGGVDGRTFSGDFDPSDKGLAGKTNDQGIYSRGLGGIFVHVELEQSIRFDATNRDLAASSLRESMLAESSLVVLDVAIRQVGAAYQATLEFNLPLDATTLQASDLVVDGSPATTVTLDSATIASFALGGLGVGSHGLELSAGAIVASNGTGSGQWAHSFNVVADSQFVVNHSPRLQLGNAPLVGYPGSETDQVELMWQTRPGGTGASDSFEVQFRMVGSTGPWSLVTSSGEIPVPSTDRVTRFIELQGLSYDTEYEYQFRHLSGGVIIDEYGASFRTRPPVGDVAPFSFAAYGDSADINDIQPFRDVQARINAVDPEFALLLGDNAYDSGTPSEADARFDSTINPEAAAWVSGRIDYVAFGNHDVQTDGSEINFSVPIPVAGVTAPVSGPAGEPVERNYSFDYGNVHFATFDTNRFKRESTLDAQLTWLEADLAASTATWKIVFGHHPVTGSPDKPESAADNYYQQVVPRLRAAGVDLFLVGHSHLYHRTYPLLGEVNGVETFVLDTDNSYDQGAGLIQVVAGTGGKSLRDGDFTQFPFNAAGFSRDTIPEVEYGFAQVDVTPSQLTVSYVAADDGAILDQFVITAGTDSLGPLATLTNPIDNGPSDLDPAAGVVSFTTAQTTIEVRLSDNGGIDETTVMPDTVSLMRDGSALVDLVDFIFSYNAATDTITLSAISGEFGSGDYLLTLNAGASKIADLVGNPMLETVFSILIDTSVSVASYQQGVAGYSGTIDTYVHQGSPAEDFSTESSLNIDTESPGGSGNAVQALLRFEDIFGSASGQVPTTASISSATLFLDVSNAGSAIDFHRMLVNWSDTDTWNSLGAGVSSDGVEASLVPDVSTGAIATGLLEIDVLASVLAWQSDPSLNQGWTLQPTGGNGVDFDSAEGSVPPRLEIRYSVDSDPSPDPDPDPDPLPSPGITVATVSNESTEAGGTGSFSVVLDSFPLSDVTIDLHSNDLSEGALAVSSLVFTAGNWETPQTVTVNGVDDTMDDGDVDYVIITAPAVSTDPGYDGLDATDVAMTNLDDDHASIVVDPTSGLVTSETGGAASFNVFLTSEPTAEVSLEFTSSDPAEGQVSGAPIIFTAGSWNSPQTVTIVGEDDSVADGDVAYVIESSVQSADAKYNGHFVSDVSVTNMDDDSTLFTVSFQSGVNAYTGTVDTMVDQGSPTEDFSTESSLNIDNDSPGGSGNQVQALLRFQDIFGGRTGEIPPGANVQSAMLYLDVSNAGSALSLHRMLTNWSDADTWSSLGGGLSADDQEAVTVADVVTSSVSTGTLAVDVTASLQSWLLDPTSNLGWAILPTGGNGVDLDSAEGLVPPRLEVQFVADSNAYPDLSPLPEIMIDPIAGLVTNETGSVATFTVVLASQPSEPVTVHLVSSDASEGTVSESSVTFTSADWNTPQAVTVTGIDDTVFDGDVDYTIETSITTSDPDYNVLEPEDVSITNQDDESAPSTQLYFSLTTTDSDNVLGLTGGDARDEDIVRYDGIQFTRIFDGSDVGVTGDIDAIAVVSENEILFSLTSSTSLPGISETVDDSDIVRFSATQLGNETAGTFSLYFDGSDVGLTADNEDVDALEVLPNGDLLISTTGSFSVTDASGADEDVIRFTPSSLGTTTAGTWVRYLDSSDFGFGGEDIDGLAQRSDGLLHLSTVSDFDAPGVSGDDEDVASMDVIVPGDDTEVQFSSTLLFDGSGYGLSEEDINAFDSVSD